MHVDYYGIHGEVLYTSNTKFHLGDSKTVNNAGKIIEYYLLDSQQLII